jgi:hypothetical protein
MSDPNPTTSLVPHRYNNTIIQQRPSDRYLDATAMCQANDKRLNNYLRNKTTQEFLRELARDRGIPIYQDGPNRGRTYSDGRIRATGEIPSSHSLIEMTHGGVPGEQGTLIHPLVAMNLAQWLSPKFAVWVAKIALERLEEINNVRTQEVQLLAHQRDEFLAKYYQSQDRLTEISLQLANTVRENQELRSNHGQSPETGPWVTIMGWHAKRGIPISHDDCKAIGKALTKLCRERGITPRTTHHDTYGYVNKYPEELITYHLTDE